MRRFVTFILIVTIFAMQSISFSHAHLPCDSEAAEHHSGRPHFHAHGKHSHPAHHRQTQHQQDDQEFAATLRGAHAADHDVDTCYLPDYPGSITGRFSVGKLRFLMVFTAHYPTVQFHYRGDVPQRHAGPLAVRSGTTARGPLYLRDRAILC